MSALSKDSKFLLAARGFDTRLSKIPVLGLGDHLPIKGPYGLENFLEVRHWGSVRGNQRSAIPEFCSVISQASTVGF